MTALYLNVKEDLLKKINSGYYKKGCIIPNEHDLADMYQVSRPTIRKAVQLLVDEGYLEKRKKRGTIVCQQKIQQEFTQFISSFDQEMAEKGLTPKTIIIVFKKEMATEEVQLQLELRENDEVYKLIRLRYIDDQPNVLLTTYIPCEIFPNLLEVDFTVERLYHIFEKEGKGITFIRRKLDTIKADETTADMLDVSRGDPLFYFHSVGYDQERVPIEYSIAKYRGDINSFVFELTNNRKP